MIILAQLDRETFDIISYKVVDDIPIKYKDYSSFSRGYVIDSDRKWQENKIFYYFNIQIILSWYGTDLLATKLLKILRKEKLENIKYE